jgi:hypothetical protein
LLVALLLAMPQALAEFRGKVSLVTNPDAPRAEWNRVPLPGAYVAVFWSVTIPAPAHATSTCPYSEIARSDEKGEYVMEGPNLLAGAVARTSFLVYSPGLESINFPAGGSLQSALDITMARSTLSSAERLSRIAGYTDPGCSGTKLRDPRGLLGPYHRDLLEEARGLKVESKLGRIELQGIEAAAQRTSGLDKPGPLHAVVKPSPGAVESSSSPPSDE